MEGINIWDKLTACMSRDEWYQQCAQQVVQTEADFITIRDMLPEAEREKIDAYIAALTTQDDCMIHLAYQLGRDSK